MLVNGEDVTDQLKDRMKHFRKSMKISYLSWNDKDEKRRFPGSR
ncbi:MAG: hypothetical protein ACLTAF_02585 [Blautia coccoides]